MSNLIIALDYDSQNDALALVDQLDPTDCALKIGSEMYTLFGPALVKLLIGRGFKIFLDLKFHDIPNTVARACAASADMGVWMLNVHAAGGFAMMAAAQQAIAGYGQDRPLLIAVTVLTSMGEIELAACLGVAKPLNEHVVYLAKCAKDAGLDGVVCSALEVPMIKTACGVDFLAVTPGIRMATDSQDDQVRVITPQLALKAGSNYLVVGRPITRSAHPQQAVNAFLKMTQQ